MEAEMDRREAELQATPEDKLQQIQNEIADDPFAEIRNKIEGQQAHADAVDELAQAAQEQQTDVVDEAEEHIGSETEPPVEH